MPRPLRRRYQGRRGTYAMPMATVNGAANIAANGAAIGAPISAPLALVAAATQSGR
jgi:hypothetical protein